LCLRWSVLAGVLVAWNALNILAMWLNGWRPHYEAKPAIAVLACAVATSAVFMWLLSFHSATIRLVVAERRTDRYHRPTFIFMGALMTLMFALLVVLLLKG